MVVWSIRLCISIVFGPWPRRYKYYARCPPDWTVQWWLSWSRTATWPGRKGDWSCLCHPGWRWHGWSRSTSPSAGVQDGGRDMTWTETMEVRDRGSTFNPLFISFFLVRLSGNFSTIQPFCFRRSIDITLLPTAFSSNHTWRLFEDYMICLVEGCMSGCVYTLYDIWNILALKQL